MKTNYLKKCMSVLLSISMLASLFAVSFTASAEEALVVDGVSYQVGDIVELKGDLQVDNWLMNGQVEVPYDSAKLKLVEGQTKESLFPALSEQGIEVYYNNLADDGVFLFNFSQPLQGVDFTTSKTLYDIKFEVIGTGTADLADAVKIVDMRSFSFAGSPEGKDDYTMVKINDENGGIAEGKGTIENVSAPAGGETPVEILTVDGKDYNVGDTFKFVGELETSRWLMNTQFNFAFDQSKLNITAVEYPVLEAAGIAVYDGYSNDEGWFTFNFSAPLVGADFTQKGELYVITFQVVGTGSTTLEDKAEIVEMSSFPFDGSPADYQGTDMYPVDITDGNGALDPANGTMDNTVKDETPVIDTLTVDGKTYDVGDTFTFVGQLQSSAAVANMQFALDFDASKLKIISTEYPAANAAGTPVVENYDNTEGWYKFNFINIDSGVDFTAKDDAYVVTFEVIGGGETTLADQAVIEVLSSLDYSSGSVEIVDLTDGNGGVSANYGNIEYVIDPEEEVPADTLNVDGTEYNVGDTVKFNIDLETARWIMNGQFSLNFDASKLQITSVKYPALSDADIAVVDNIANESGFFTFNFTDIANGVDFTTKNVLVAMEFEVIGTGETSLINNSKFDVLSSFNFDGSPADPENEGIIIEIVDITDGNGGVAAEAGSAEYYYGEPNIVEKFTVNGEEVKAGDIVEYRVWVKNEGNWLVNGEFDILYTNQYLTLVDVTYPGLITIAGYVVDNHIADSGLTESQGKPAGEVLFNFSNIHSGVDFTQGAYMAVLTFEVHEAADENIPAQGASVIELNGNVVNDMYAFMFEGSGSMQSIENKKEFEKLIGPDGLPTTDEFRLETEIFREITVDTTALQDTYDKWSQLDTTGYTAESVAALEAALAEAKNILDDIAAGNADAYTQDIIDAQTAALNAAGEDLVVDKSALVDLIADAQAIVDDTDTLYVPATIEALKQAIANAQAVVDSDDASVADVSNEITALQTAIDGVKLGAYLGDANYDGIVTIDDATIIQYYIAKFDPDGFYFALADVDKDGIITIEDATLVQMIIANEIEAEIVAIPTV